MKNVILTMVLYLVAIIPANAQNNPDEDNSFYDGCTHQALNIGSDNSGISFGNSRHVNGLRFNFSDCGIEEVNGLNFTLWRPGNNPGSVVNGLSFGVSPSADVLNGISVGIAANIAGSSMTGINFAILANVSDEDITGFNIGGLTSVADGNITGFNFGGMALVADGSLQGVNIGGLASVSEGDMGGVNFSSL
ncbi:MAG: hypothetical protein R6W90_18155, partial [Ignavibacteriaceae bacterium]